MTGKPHFYMTFGYWNCKCDGFHGSDYSMKGAAESMLKHKRFWMRTIGRAPKDMDLT
jgi:hypothetical protein